MRELHAWENGHHVGVFSEDDEERISFAYDANEGLPISLSLPRTGGWRDQAPRNFLDNLLPDNPNVRQAMREHLNASSAGVFDLLDRVDATGGLVFSLSPEPPIPSPTLRLISDSQIANEIDRIERTRNYWWDMARPGDLMCFGMLRDSRLLIIIAQHDSTAEAQAKWLFGIDDEQDGAFRFHDNTERELDAFGAQIFEALGINVEVRDDTHLPEMIGRWGYRFPSNEEFAAFSQSSLTDVDPAHDDPDDVVIEYYDRSYLLFKLYERAVIQHDYDAAPFVSDGVIDVDSFTSFYTSVRNRRMSRAGKVLEIHIAHILDARGIEYEAQARTENGKKPDFLFPSQAAYEDPTFPETQLRMLASKTSIKDRFRQVADEANRIRDKHLFTLTPGDVTHPKLAQLDELHIHLVMPKVVKESYDDLIQGETMTFSRFIEEVQGLQAGRPQSLTLL